MKGKFFFKAGKGLSWKNGRRTYSLFLMNEKQLSSRVTRSKYLWILMSNESLLCALFSAALYALILPG